MASPFQGQTLRLLGLLLVSAGLAACGSANPSSSSSIAPLPATSIPAGTALAPSATPASTTSPAPSPTLGFVPGTKASPRVVALVADDQLSFFPNVVTVAEGETVTFEIKNVGKAQHEFMLGPAADAFADKEGTPEVADIAGGQTKTLTFTFTGPGPYAFACHEPGHFETGMLGYVIVVGPDVPAVGATASPRLVEVAMSDQLKFMPDQIPVTPGETVTFLLTNEGTAVHEFAVGPSDKVDADEVDGKLVVEADEIDRHRIKTVTYTFDGPGPYAFACHEPGHFEAGMRGTITPR
jgi:uncharacterized cupredoxin-like copper-binding protein